MPYGMGQGHGCTGSKPWAVFKTDTGAKVACHATKQDAQKHLVALKMNVPEAGAPMTATDIRAVGSIGGVSHNDLPDSSFAHIESGGTKDSEGKTTPRSLRHFPIKDANGKCDAPHVRNALARASQSPFGSKAMPKIKACATQLGIGEAKQSDDNDPEGPEEPGEPADKDPDPGSFVAQDPDGDGFCEHCGEAVSAHKQGPAGNPGMGMGPKTGGLGVNPQQSNSADSRQEDPDPGSFFCQDPDRDGVCEHCGEACEDHKQPAGPAASSGGTFVPAQSNSALPTDDLVRAVYPGAQLTMRDNGDGDGEATGPVMHGHFAVFNTWTEINSLFEGTFMESISPGAFKRTINNNRSSIRAIFQHGHDPQVGDKPLGPVEVLKEDDQGAYFEVPLLDAPYVRDLVLPGLEAGLYGASFRFKVTREEMNDDPGESEQNPKGLPERTIKEIALREFGPVTYPAYPEASAGVRSMTDDLMLGKPDELLRSLATRVAAINGGNGYDPDVLTDDSARSCGCAACEHRTAGASAPDLRVTASRQDRDYLIPKGKDNPPWQLP